MSINKISRDEFDSLSVERYGFFPERAWFKSTGLDLAGTIILDPFDKDWSYVLVAKDEDGTHRYIEGEVSLSSQQDAEEKLLMSATRIDLAGAFKEELYTEPESVAKDETKLTIIYVPHVTESLTCLKVHSVYQGDFCMSRVTMENLKPEKQRSPLHRTNLGMRIFSAGFVAPSASSKPLGVEIALVTPSVV